MMLTKKKLLALILMLLALPVYGFSNSPNQQGSLYRKPLRLRLEREIRRLFPQFYGKSFPQEVLLIEEIYPIGWSRDGKFAYYSEPADEACGCYFANLSILDLVSDKVLWEFDYNSEDMEEAKQQRRPYTFNMLWRSKAREFSAKLKEYGIEQQAGFALQFFPASHAGDRLSVDLKLEELDKSREEDRIYGIISKAALQLNSQRSGKKTLFEQSYGEYQWPLAMKVLGYLKSPFEPRVAVFLTHIQRGYEGPPHVAQTTIVGAHLTNGFK